MTEIYGLLLFLVTDEGKTKFESVYLVLVRQIMGAGHGCIKAQSFGRTQAYRDQRLDSPLSAGPRARPLPVTPVLGQSTGTF